MQPQLVNHFSTDEIRLARGVICYWQPHEVGLTDELKLPEEVRYLFRISFKNHFQEGRPITSANIEIVNAECGCCEVHIRSFKQQLSNISLSKRFDLC